jgi:acetyltransferase-like isoleucine patch superfamily enzyme
MFSLFSKRKGFSEVVSPCQTLGNVHILEKNGGKIYVHESVLLNSNQAGYHVGMPFETTLLADAEGAVISIGKNCRIHGSYIHAWKNIEIGCNVLIAAGTSIVDSNGHSSDIRYARFRQNFKDTPKEIIVGDYAWIGMNCMILKGVHIGECAIISAGSVVKETVPAFAVVEGNPAKVIRIMDSNEALDRNISLEKLRQEKGFYNY